MSLVTSSLGSAWSSSHVQLIGSAAPRISNVHSSSGVCGVGPAESTGKSSVRYCPGGTRSGGPDWRRPTASRPGSTSPRLPGALGRPDAAHAARRVDVLDRGRRRAARWTWDEFQALPSEDVTIDIHCVTKWSKLDTTWEGVSLDTLLDAGRARRRYALAFCDGGYTTNLPLEDVSDGKAWVAFDYDGEPLEPEHGGPARLLVPHLYFWKSAKWVRGLSCATRTSPASGSRTATTCAAIRGWNSGTGATDLARGRVAATRTETPRVRRSSSTSPAGPATAPASTSTCA